MSRYKINIMEHQYYINTDRDPAWVKMLQERLNGQIDEIREGCPNLSAFDTFALLTMNLMDQLAKSEEAAAVSSSNYFAQAKLEKENSRSKSLEILEQTAANQEFDEDIRKKAQQQILDTASNVEKETAIESAAKAKGFKEISVYIDGENVEITVKKKDFSETDAAKLKDIASSQLSVDPANVKIVEVK